ncbi:hypothetical protein [Agrococcus sp. ARC_14]|uniref:hypothetical protein n=1 Tax=Agrococcus sp. ARC_14 TaxID=2919927 RepID=UPI001F0664FC|nr:hypothetical protein [Agrococcus sp. ARC_14]MCH1884142.1 hypothetical protein [Agrococcus sp. ARC_14]
MSLPQLSGEWPVVEGHGETYRRTAAAIEQAIVHLQQIRDEDSTVARAFDRVRDAAGEVSTQLDRATSRYEVTGTALVDYAEQLRIAQASADEAIEQWDAADARLQEAVTERDRLDAADDASATSHELLVAEQQAVVDTQASVRAEAEAAWRAAGEHKEQAAAFAEARIRDEIDDAAINDSFWDDVWGAVGDFFEAIADALVEVLAWLAAIVVTAIAVVVIAALALALLATGLVGLIIGGLMLLMLATWVLTGGGEAFIGTLVETGSLEAALLAGTIAWLRGTLPWLADWLIAGDDGSPVLLWDAALTPKHGQAGTWGDYLARLQADNRAVDAHTGSPDSDPKHSSMIAVTAVTGPDGQTVYRINVPSTQQWLPGTASINDLHSDLAAKLGDGPTQLEQAVRQACVEAGVPDGASVVLTGWSLGGITAANLAADPDFAATYAIDAVIVAGASIDDAAIPTHIPVLSFEHSGGTGAVFDPVPHTEDPSKPCHADDPNRTTVRVEPPAIAGPVPHHGLGYQQTMQEQGDKTGSLAGTWMALHDLDRYFVGVEQQHVAVFERGD